MALAIIIGILLGFLLFFGGKEGRAAVAVICTILFFPIAVIFSLSKKYK